LLGRGNGRNGAGGNARNSDGDQGGVDKKEQRRLAAERRKALAPLKKRVTEAETAVHHLETEKARLAEAMADPDLYRGDSNSLVDLKKRLGRVEKDLASAEEAWIGAQEAFDRVQAKPV
jgi:ATP-binding cassette subfamily F protein 3